MMFEKACVRPELALEQDVLAPQRLPLDLLADLELQLVDVEGLREVVARPEPERLDGRLGRRKRGDDDAADLGVDGAGAAQHVDAAHVGHLEIGDQHVEPPALERREGRASVIDRNDLVAFPREDDRQQLAHRPLVVGHEHPRRGPGGRGFPNPGRPECSRARSTSGAAGMTVTGADS